MKSQEFFWIYVQARTYLGSSLSLSGQYLEAAQELMEALSLETQPLARYYIRFWLGDAYYQLGELEKAREQLEGTSVEAESAPKEGLSTYYAARSLYELALIDYKQHRFADARRHLELASKIGAEDGDLLRVIERLNVAVNQSERQ
jgi:tetratricopeptide (TPR) repeat protein